VHKFLNMRNGHQPPLCTLGFHPFT
jgi:hypothetical protein